MPRNARFILLFNSLFNFLYTKCQVYSGNLAEQDAFHWCFVSEKEQTPGPIKPLVCFGAVSSQPIMNALGGVGPRRFTLSRPKTESASDRLASVYPQQHFPNERKATELLIKL
jgi:hypothetical protein